MKRLIPSILCITLALTYLAPSALALRPMAHKVAREEGHPGRDIDIQRRLIVGGVIATILSPVFLAAEKMLGVIDKRQSKPPEIEMPRIVNKMPLHEIRRMIGRIYRSVLKDPSYIYRYAKAVLRRRVYKGRKIGFLAADHGTVEGLNLTYSFLDDEIQRQVSRKTLDPSNWVFIVNADDNDIDRKAYLEIEFLSKVSHKLGIDMYYCAVNPFTKQHLKEALEELSAELDVEIEDLYYYSVFFHLNVGHREPSVIKWAAEQWGMSERDVIDLCNKKDAERAKEKDPEDFRRKDEKIFTAIFRGGNRKLEGLIKPLLINKKYVFIYLWPIHRDVAFNLFGGKEGWQKWHLLGMSGKKQTTATLPLIGAFNRQYLTALDSAA